MDGVCIKSISGLGPVVVQSSSIDLFCGRAVGLNVEGSCWKLTTSIKTKATHSQTYYEISFA